jgi:hypothetical protein
MTISFLFSLISGLVINGLKPESDAISCTTTTSQFQERLMSYEYFMQLVDKAFCSDNCPCYLNDSTKNYYKNQNLTYFNSLVLSNDKRRINFDYCPGSVRDQVIETYEQKYPTHNITRPSTFIYYWSTLEVLFNCRGFCNKTYVDANSNQLRTFQKNLFTDVNK